MSSGTESVAYVGWLVIRSESPPNGRLRGGPLSVPRSTMPKRKQGHKEEDEGDSESETVAGFLFFLKSSAEACPVEPHPSRI